MRSIPDKPANIRKPRNAEKEISTDEEKENPKFGREEFIDDNPNGSTGEQSATVPPSPAKEP